MYQQIWKDIPTWEKYYQCSNFGRVKNKITGLILKLTTQKHNYKSVKLTHKKRKECWLVHRLVATTWVRAVKENEDCHHKNHFPWCNCVNNIQIKDQFTHLHDHKQGFKHSDETKKKISELQKGRKLSPETVAKRQETRRLRKLNNPNYGVGERTAWNKGKTLSQQHKKKLREAKQRKQMKT